MLVGYVSDEQYVALAGVSLEFEQQGKCIAAVHSTSRGGVHAEIEAGNYRVSLSRQGFGSKGVEVLARGGGVFSVGSMTYPASLLVDPIVSRITSNVIRRFLSPDLERVDGILAPCLFSG
jgi:hypothetical protein